MCFLTKLPFAHLNRLDGTESVLDHNNSNKSSNILLDKALPAPSIHRLALKDFATYAYNGGRFKVQF